MTTPTPYRAADIPDAHGVIDHAAWSRAYRAWERRRALPAELEALDRKEAMNRARSHRGQPRGRPSKVISETQPPIE